jgi:hypothetical protein
MEGAPNIMTLHTPVSVPAPANDAEIEYSFPYRAYERPRINGKCVRQPLRFSVTLMPANGLHGTQLASVGLYAALAFLVDTAHVMVPAATLARMIGCLCLATNFSSSVDPEPGAGICVSLTNTLGGRATARVDRADLESERTAFGAAHILYEDDTLGLHILEIAPHSTIPAHCHRIMRESELILDDGLLQQNQPVARGNAYAWPLGYVHAYRNPTDRPKRILCVDSPRFMPGDEVPLAVAPPLTLLAPLTNYLV